MIKITGLYKTFDSRPVLDGVNLDVNPGETMVVIGGSGCGKSVLLRHIIGLMQPDRGSVQIDGIELAGIGRRELFSLRKRLGMLFQGAALFDSLTVEENVSLALREHSGYPPQRIAEIVGQKLDLAGMAGTQGLMPSQLSGGMKKRVGLARAIAMDPEYMLYDEPTTGLDPIMADKINDLIIELREKMSLTSVVVTHDMVSAAKIADRIAMLHQGRIIFCGTPEEIKRSPDERVQRFIKGEAD